MSKFIAVRPLEKSVGEIREFLDTYPYVLITDDKFFLMDFSQYKAGCYYIAYNNMVYPVKDPSFLVANGLARKD